MDLLTFFIVIFVSTMTSVVESNPTAQVLQNLLPKDIQELVRNKTLQKLRRSDFIPNFPKHLQINETTFSIDSENAKGTLILGNTVVDGLNSLMDDVDMNLITFKITALFHLPEKVSGHGEYNLDGKVNPGEEESTTVAGHGSFRGSVNNLKLAVETKLDVGLLTGKVTIQNLDLQVSYDSIALDADNFSMNDETVDWDSVNVELNENFENLWGQYQEPLTLAITEGVNELLSEASLTDIIDVFQGKKTVGQLIKHQKI